MKKSQQSDAGSAIVIVMIMVVVLSLWFASVAMLVQSSNAAVTKNVQLNQQRATQLNGAFVDALRQLSQVSGSTITRLGTDPNLGAAYAGLGCDNALNKYYPDSTGDPGLYVEIACTQSTGSGGDSNQVLGSLVLTGKSGTVGVQQGLAFAATGTSSCASSTSLTNDTTFTPYSYPSSLRLTTTGGLINVSGAWSSADCKNLGLMQSGKLRPSIIQPDGSTCPSSWYVYKYNSSSSKYDASQITSSADTYGDCQKLPSTDLDPDVTTGSALSTALLGFTDLAPAVTTAASFVPADTPTWTTTGTPASGGVDTFGQTSCGGGPCRRFVEVRPGIINETMVTKLNNLTCATCGAGASYGAIVFLPGVYKFTATTPWTIAKPQFVIVGGKPNWSSMPTDLYNKATDNTAWSFSNVNGTCSNGSGTGVQFQFSGSSSIVLTNGRMILCRDTDQNLPLIFAPSSDMASNGYTSFSWSGTGALITANSSCANGGQHLIVKGAVFAPGGSFDLNLCQYKSTFISDTAILRALKISTTSAVMPLSTAIPPTAALGSSGIGDRMVQLSFTSSRLGSLGVVQVAIHDNGGKNIASGYRIIAWRAAW